MISLGIQGRDALHCMLLEKAQSVNTGFEAVRPSEASIMGGNGIGLSIQDPGYSSGEATVTPESILSKPRNRLASVSRSNLRRRGGAEPAHRNGLDRASGLSEAQRFSPTELGVATAIEASNTGGSSHVRSLAAAREEKPHQSMQTPLAWNALYDNDGEVLSQSALRLRNCSTDPEQTASPTPTQIKHGLVRSLSFESRSGKPYPLESLQYQRTGAFLGLERSDVLQFGHVGAEAPPSRQSYSSTAENTPRKASDTRRQMRIPARRLSEGSSCGSGYALRPKLNRNFSSTNSVNSHWSRLSANDTDGLSSNTEFDDRSITDIRLLARLGYNTKTSGKSMYSTEDPASPLSEDGFRLSGTISTLAFGPKRDAAAKKPIILPILLLGLRLLAVVPATVGSLAILWSILQGETKGAQAVANALMALPWVSTYTTCSARLYQD